MKESCLSGVGPMVLLVVLAGATLSACNEANCPAVVPGLRETTIATDFDTVALGVAATADGGAIVAGYVSGFLSATSNNDPGEYEKTFDAYVVKTNAGGGVEWETTMCGDEARHILPTGDGGFLVLGNRGSSYGLASGPRDPPTIFVAKIDSDGNVLWTVDPEVEPFTTGHGIGVSDDGSFAIAGITPSLDFQYSDDALVIGFNAAGTELWRQRFGSEDRVYRLEIAASHDGGYVLAGGDRYLFAVKVGPEGQSAWEYDGAELPRTGSFSFPSGIVATRDNGFVIIGQSGGRVKLDRDGNFQWQASALQAPLTYSFSVVEESSGDFCGRGEQLFGQQ